MPQVRMAVPQRAVQRFIRQCYVPRESEMPASKGIYGSE